MDHRAVHLARQHLQQAFDRLEEAEHQKDPQAQRAAMGLAGNAALEAVAVISRVRRELNAKARTS